MTRRQTNRLVAKRAQADTRRAPVPDQAVHQPYPAARFRQRGRLFPVTDGHATCEVCGMTPDEQCGVCR